MRNDRLEDRNKERAGEKVRSLGKLIVEWGK